MVYERLAGDVGRNSPCAYPHPHQKHPWGISQGRAIICAGIPEDDGSEPPSIYDRKPK